MASGVRVTARGPIFRPSEINTWMGRTKRKIEIAVGQWALWQIKAYNAADFKHPTGHYRSQLHVVTRGVVEVNDSASVKGPWLEGTGSRNSRSRFKGYWHWRRTNQRATSAANRIAREIVATATREIS
jgi:hypothetical protein